MLSKNIKSSKSATIYKNIKDKLMKRALYEIKSNNIFDEKITAKL